MFWMQKRYVTDAVRQITSDAKVSSHWRIVPNVLWCKNVPNDPLTVPSMFCLWFCLGYRVFWFTVASTFWYQYIVQIATPQAFSNRAIWGVHWKRIKLSWGQTDYLWPHKCTCIKSACALCTYTRIGTSLQKGEMSCGLWSEIEMALDVARLWIIILRDCLIYLWSVV